MARQPCVYIMASRRHGTIYVGVTSNLMARIHQHRQGTFKGFTAEHNIKRLVHFEMLDDMRSAITRENQLKNWHRDWKINLIERDNPFWEDRALWFGFEPLPRDPSC